MFSEYCNFVRNSFFLLYIAANTEQLKNTIHSLATLYDLITDIFLETLFSAKSNDLICDLYMGQAVI